MVILQFNKLIRNKWVWGVFAVIVSAAFCFDDLFTTRRNEERAIGDAGLLGGEKVTVDAFADARQEVLGFGRNRDDGRSDYEVNLDTWKRIAAERIAAADGVVVSDAALANAISRMFGMQGGFSFAQYSAQLAQQFGITPERFEAALRRDMAVNQGVHGLLVGSAAFVSPMELDLAVADATDRFTVQVARFTQPKEKADAVTVDDDGLKKWYDANTAKLALPERIKIRYIRFNANSEDVLAKMTVTEDEMRDMYDSTIEKYTSTDTNGVETVKPFEEVKDGIERELRVLAAVDYFTTNLQRRVYANLAEGEDPNASRLDKIAAEDGATVVESDWFTLDGNFVEGFMRRAETIAPGAKEFKDRVAEIDPAVPDLRYGLAASDNAVWLFERSALSEAHTPSFEEAKGSIGAQALRDAKAEAFKADVAEIAKGGVEAILATENVSTNITYSLVDLQRGAFPDQTAVVRAAAKLKKGEASELVQTSPGRGFVVVCNDRTPGDAAAAINLRDELRSQLAMARYRDLSAKWDDAILSQFGLEASVGYETAEPADAEDAASED